MLNCSFCEKAETEVAYLFKGPRAQICDNCVVLASAILQERSSKTSSTTEIDVSVYKTDYGLAKLLTKERILRHRFIPLDLYKGIIVLAVTDIGSVSRITNELKSALKDESAYKGKNIEINVLLATNDSLKGKIQNFIDWCKSETDTD